MKSYSLTLLRHGLCEGEAEGRYIGHTDAPLTEEGEAQLLRMREEFNYPPADALFVSPLRRCTQTAALLYPGHNGIELSGLREYYFGEYENKSPAELEGHPLFVRWISGEAGLVPPFAEELPDFQNRITNTFIALTEGLIKTGVQHSVLITHGGILMALLAAFGLPQAPMHEWLTPSGTGYTLRVEPSLWMRTHKCEVTSLAPKEGGQPDILEQERSLWRELEET
ncbi:MAG: histidine phosphatase family protein, partial [Oscillospiraceae bacterium]|nr:histidine phosphatase family protein [Oscillospiraceae bacterium]